MTLDDDSEAETQLRDRVARLEQRVSMLTAVLRLVLALLRVSGFKVDLIRIPDAEGKRRLLSAVERARKIMPLAAALRVLGLSAARQFVGLLCTRSASAKSLRIQAHGPS